MLTGQYVSSEDLNARKAAMRAVRKDKELSGLTNTNAPFKVTNVLIAEILAKYGLRQNIQIKEFNNRDTGQDEKYLVVYIDTPRRTVNGIGGIEVFRQKIEPFSSR